MRSSRLLWLSLIAILALSAAPRWLLGDRTPSQGGHWTLADPDSLYHARRVERALLEDGLPAGSDAFLNHPEGAAIPWPPYYDGLAALALGPFVAQDAGGAARGSIERGVGRLPLIFGLLASLVALLAARQLAGNLAGLAAGGLHALALGSIVYSRIGNGDHHAFLSWLSAVILLGFACILGGERLRSRKFALLAGSALGALAGLAIGSWVAALMLVVVIDATFGVLLILHARQPRPGLVAFGASFHIVALLTLLPAVLASPWKDDFPWMVVNLSWFHVMYLGLGALVFAPLAGLDVRGRAFRIYPALVALALLLLAAASSVLERGPIAGIVEGFDWVSRQNTFMSGIEESRPLFGAGAVPGGVFTYLGAFAWLLPLAWLAGVRRLWRDRQLELLPWVIAVPPLAVQAAGQVRFAEALVLPAAVLVAWFVVKELPWHRLRAPRALAVPLVLVLVGASQGATCARLWSATQGSQSDPRRKRASRELCDWVANQAVIGPPTAVLATWNRGHEIEWAARRPSVATNFGSYVGKVGFLSPARFFLANNSAQAEAVLEERDAQLVMLSVDLSDALPGWIQAGPAEWNGRYYSLDANGQGQLRKPWFESVGGQLLNGGFARTPRGQQRGDSLDFLRLVHVSPTRLRSTPISAWRGPTPYGWVWERVPGARVQLHGAPQTPVAVEIELEYAGARDAAPRTLLFVQSATLDSQGRATLRVPYNTTERNGDGRVLRALWHVGDASGPLHIDEDAVQTAQDIHVNP